MTLTRQQVQQLLKPINPDRVLKDQDGHSNVTQQDDRAHLNRIFGFGNWDEEILELRLLRDATVTVPAKNNRPEREVPAVTYLCMLRLTIRDPYGNHLARYEEVGTGTSPNLPTYGDAHDFASKNAVSYALKRCCTNLGDQFGLSLYNRGQLTALVKGTLVMPGPDGSADADVQHGVEKQVDMGDESPDSMEIWGRISEAAKRLGWDQETVEQDFAREHGGEVIDNATLPQLLDYCVRLEVSTPDVAGAA